jgi:hypothetical protein
MSGIFWNEHDREIYSHEKEEPPRSPAEYAKDAADMQAFLAEAFAEMRKKVVREAQADLERELISIFDEDFAPDVERAITNATPDPKMRKRFGEAISKFGTFARENGYCSMPAAGAAIGTWLISSAMAGRRPAQLRRDAEAMRFAHRLNNAAIIDEIYADAGLQIAIRIANAGDDGGGIPKPSDGAKVHADCHALPLAAASI